MVGLAVVALGAVLLTSTKPPRLHAELQQEENREIQLQPTPAMPPAEKDSAEKPCAGCGAKEVKTGEKRAAAYLAPPFSCALLPIMEFDGGYAIYEAERHNVVGCTSPLADYVYGSYTWPMICPDCSIPVCKVTTCELTGFKGLHYPVPYDHQYLLPRIARPHCAPVANFPPTGFNQFLEFVDIDRKVRHVKVFQYDCNLGLFLTPQEPTYQRKITIALESSKPPTGTADQIPAGDCVPLPDPCHPDSIGCFIYRLTYKDTQIITIVVKD
jgi:hypothetical protein